jgi:WD40 repeat protein
MRTMPFGLYRDRPLAEIPVGYLTWLTPRVKPGPVRRTLASGDESGTVKLWAVAPFREVASLEGREGKVYCLAFSPDGQTLAAGAETGHGKGEVFLWRAPRPAP